MVNFILTFKLVSSSTLQNWSVCLFEKFLHIFLHNNLIVYDELHYIIIQIGLYA